MVRIIVKVSFFALLLTSLAWIFTPGLDAQKKENDPAVLRARKTVQMLDDIYKTGIVLMTEAFVKDKKDYPAGRLAVKWFEAVNKKGWHETRIIDVTGDPINAANVANDAFEKEAVQQIKAGQKYFEKLEQKDGKSTLRAMTFIPVVLDQCILCHDHYKDAKKGAAIGALTYTISLD